MFPFSVFYFIFVAMEENLLSIIDRVTQLYQQYGIKSVTMDDVARELGISKKTLYKYVNDKADLVDKVMDRAIDVQFKYMISRIHPEMNAIDILLTVSELLSDHWRSMNMSITYDLQKYYPQVWGKIMDFRHVHVLEHISKNMQKGIKEGLYRKDLDVELIAHFYIIRMEALCKPEYAELKSRDFKDVFNKLYEYHIRGIANAEGIKYYENKIKNKCN